MREITKLNVQHFLEQVADHLFGQAHDVSFVEEAGLDVDLSKFRLTVGTQVFVAEALGNLVVTVKTSNHQQLFEQLRRLRQGKEASCVGTARHQIVTRTFWCCTREDWCFNVQKTIFVQEAANTGGHARAQTQFFGHFRATQVNEAIAQTRFFTDVRVFVERERRRFSFVQNFQLITQHFDCTRSHVGIASTGRTQTYLTGHLDDVLTAYTVSSSKGFCTIGIEYNLSQTFTVTDIKEDNPAMVSTTVYPAA